MDIIGEKVKVVYQEEVMNSSVIISKALPQNLVGTFNITEEVQLVDVELAGDEEPANEGKVEDLNGMI